MSRLKTYYTESEIQKHLYTNGNEFMTPDKKEYRGARNAQSMMDFLINAHSKRDLQGTRPTNI